MAKKIDIDIAQEAITLIKREKTQWESSTAFITEKVAFNMRNLIRQVRKNYWGVFETPIDPITGRKKIWIPLSETMVENVVKNIDIDTKDINFRAKNNNAIPLTHVARSSVKNRLDDMYFGEDLDEFERQLSIDGTAIWKTIEVNKDGKKTFEIKNVDLLNFYIDPTAKSIQEAESVIERALMTPDEVSKMKGWVNNKNVEGKLNLNRNDAEFNTVVSAVRSEAGKLVEVFERWGLMPLSFITGKDKDKDTFVHGRIIASNIESDAKIHLIELNKRKDENGSVGLKPYEEAWLTRIPGRWYGKGVCEKLLMLQLYLNTIVNIRVSRSYVSQLGIFKIKRGSGITPQMIGRLATNGAVAVQDMDDIQQMVMQEASQASYNDEQNIQSWSERLTSAFQVVTGEQLPASTTATVGAIQAQNAQSQFTLIKEGVGMFLQRWLKRHALPILVKDFKKSDIVSLTGDIQQLQEFDDLVIKKLTDQEIEKMIKDGKEVTIQEIQEAEEEAREELAKMGDVRFAEIFDNINISDFDVQVFVTNEETDKSVLVQNLVSVLQVAPEFREQIIQNIFDLMGLRFKPLQQSQVQGLPPQQQEGQASSSVDQITQALTAQGSPTPQAV